MNETAGRPRIVVVDDDPQIRQLLSQVLERYGFSATALEDGRGLQAQAEPGGADLIVLDLMLPGTDGLSLCRELRKRSQIPIIILTARGDPVDRIVGLEIGADDYLAKPFDPRELVARIRTVLRRSQGARSSAGRGRGFAFEGWSFDTLKRELRNAQAQLVPLSGTEFRLLELLLSQANQILTRDRIMEAVAGRPMDPFERRIDIAISRLRNRLGDVGREPRLIKTVRNRGYVFAAEVASL